MRKGLNGILQNALFISLGSYCARGVGFLFGILVSRFLLEDGLGAYTIAFTYLGFFLTLSAFGLDPLLQREVARNPREAGRFFFHGALLRILLSLLSIPLFLLLPQALGYSAEIRSALSFLALCLFTEGIIGAGNATLLGLERMLPSAVLSVSFSLFTLLGGTVILLLGGGIKTVASLFLFRGIFHVLSMAWILGKIVGKRLWIPKPAFLLGMVRSAAPFVLLVLLTRMHDRLDIFILKEMGGEAEVGIYSAAYLILDGLLLLPVALSSAFYPALSRELAGDRRRFQVTLSRGIRLVLLAVLPGLLLLPLFSREIPRFLYGPPFLASAGVLSLFGIVLVLEGLNNLLGRAIYAAGREKLLTLLTALLVPLNIGLNLLLIPPYGPWGCALAKVLSFGAGTAFHVTLLLGYLPGSFLLRKGKGILPALAVAWVPTLLLKAVDIPGLVVLLVFFLLYIPAIFLFRALSANERRKIMKILPLLREGKWEERAVPQELEKTKKTSVLSLPRVCVITINWNGEEDTIEFLRAALALEYPSMDILVVDNGSKEENFRKLREAFPWASWGVPENPPGEKERECRLHFLRCSENGGFTGGNNAGIEFAGKYFNPHFYLVLNNDTIPAPSLAREMVSLALEYPRAGIIGAINYDRFDSSRILSTGGRLNLWKGTYTDMVDRNGKWRHGRAPKGGECATEVECVVGSSMLIRASCMEEIGPLEGGFFCYLDETDWCTRFRKRGYQVLLSHRAKVLHKRGATMNPPLTFYFRFRNTPLFMARNAKMRHFIIFIPYFAFTAGLKMFVYFLKGKTEIVRSIWMGLVDALMGRYGKGRMEEIGESR